MVEDAALLWLRALGYAVAHGPEIAHGEPAAERADPGFRDVVLEGRLRSALARLNPDLPDEAIEDGYRRLTRAELPTLLERNRAMHRLLINGVPVEFRRPDGTPRSRRPSGASGGRCRRYRNVDSSTHNWVARRRTGTARATISFAIMTCSLRNLAIIRSAPGIRRGGCHSSRHRQAAAGIWVFMTAGIWVIIHTRSGARSSVIATVADRSGC
ncbi:MAG TPA: type I restriction endonuclease [Gemmatimonadales bacterium]|nr:type I restriction endonuclease [Gemmatimonadales bacterium]